MPQLPDDFEPSEADIDMLVEEVTGKPVKPANIAAGIALMGQRIKELESSKTRLLAQMDTANESQMSGLNECLVSINKDLTTARERLTHYQWQLGKQN